MQTIQNASLFVVPSLLFILSAGCQDASFTGGAKSRAKLETTLPGVVSCTVDQEQINVGEMVTITVDNSAEDKVILFQSIRFADNTIGSRLIYGDSGYKVDGGGNNTFKAALVGQYDIELRLSENAAVSASCGFVAIDPSNPNATPGTNVGANPGTNPGSNPGSNPGTTPGTNPGSNPDTTPGTNPGSNPDTTPGEPICSDSEESIGAHVAFLIDNSNSNAATDCTNPQQIGEFSGSKLYQCQSETNREKAVLSAYDTLAAVAANEASNADAMSRLAIASFPTMARYVDGYGIEAQFSDVNSNRNAVQSALSFTRKPFGLTPYGAAMSAASELFAGVNDGRAKVAVLVTDGEPTDSDPNGVKAQAQALRAQGIEVITVYVTQKVNRVDRRDRHVAMMDRINQSSVDKTGRSWFAGNYASFDAYVDSLLGDGSSGGLVRSVSDKIVEVEDSSALKAAFQEIIRTRVISCREAR